MYFNFISFVILLRGIIEQTHIKVWFKINWERKKYCNIPEEYATVKK